MGAGVFNLGFKTRCLNSEIGIFDTLQKRLNSYEVRMEPTCLLLSISSQLNGVFVLT